MISFVDVLILTYNYGGLCGLVVRVPGYRSRDPGFDSRLYRIFWEVVGLERGPLSLMRITEELLERKIAASVYKTEINGRGDSLGWPRNTLYPLKLALSSPTSGGRLVGVVRWRTETPEFVVVVQVRPSYSNHSESVRFCYDPVRLPLLIPFSTY
jgi:hypothetical protein